METIFGFIKGCNPYPVQLIPSSRRIVRLHHKLMKSDVSSVSKDDKKELGALAFRMKDLYRDRDLWIEFWLIVVDIIIHSLL